MEERRQITEKNPLTQVTTSSYQFDPTPRPVVTQPIKFFNEANRSGSGVEDAILGLIAEKTVEYRGQTFTSPSFIGVPNIDRTSSLVIPSLTLSQSSVDISDGEHPPKVKRTSTAAVKNLIIPPRTYFVMWWLRRPACRSGHHRLLLDRLA